MRRTPHAARDELMWYGLVIGILATWRVTHLLSAEDGPFRVVARLRRAAGNGFWGELLDCFYCLSLWVAAPLAALLSGSVRESVLLWLALSGGAILLERATRDHAERAAEYFEHSTGADDAVLRQEQDVPPAGAGRSPVD